MSDEYVAVWQVTLRWRGQAELEVLQGSGSTCLEAAANAITGAGYGAGALRALDSWDATLLAEKWRDTHLPRAVLVEAYDAKLPWEAS